MSNSKIEQLTVKIYLNYGVAIGSGTLYVPKEDGENAYVFTAAHVASQGLDVKYLEFKILVNEEEKKFETKEEDAIKLHDKYERDAQVKTYDVAVIKVIKEDWMKSLPTLTIGTPTKEMCIEGKGFPISAHENNLGFAMMPLNGQAGRCSDENQRFHLILSNELRNPCEELPGYSGSGLYEQRETESDLVLIGIFSYGQGQNAIQNTANAFYGRLLKDICYQYGWEQPEDANQAPSSFTPYVCDAINIIENDSVREDIDGIIKYIIEEGVKPASLINTTEDLYDIPKCINNDRVRCKICWISRLRLISILAMLDVKVDKLREPEVLVNDKSIPVEFFCSEGSEGNSQMRKVIRSIFNTGFIWKNKFRDNAILVWASKDTQTHKTMTRTDLSRLIGDICKESVNRIKKYDTMYGEGKNNDLSIIHIDELMKAIDVEEHNDVKNSVLEVFKNVIS